MSQTNHPFDAGFSAGTPLNESNQPQAPKIVPMTPKVQPPKLCLSHTAFSTPIETQIDALRDTLASIETEIQQLQTAVAWLAIDTDLGLQVADKETNLGKRIVALARTLGMTLYE